eukprot:scaffold26686_cov122-Isochrysis_galbana.AAC.3
MKESSGTEPGIFSAARKPKMPIIARRPLLISAHSFAERVKEVGHLVQRDVVELGILARLPTAHVVHPTKLAPPLQEADEGDDLCLCGKRQRIPLLGRREARSILGLRDTTALQVERKVDAVGLHAESHKGGHGDAAVFNLRVAEEAIGSRVALRPEVGGAQTDRVD